jgi:hypothetical protein
MSDKKEDERHERHFSYIICDKCPRHVMFVNTRKCDKCKKRLCHNHSMRRFDLQKYVLICDECNSDYLQEASNFALNIIFTQKVASLVGFSILLALTTFSTRYFYLVFEYFYPGLTWAVTILSVLYAFLASIIFTRMIVRFVWSIPPLSNPERVEKNK